MMAPGNVSETMPEHVIDVHNLTRRFGDQMAVNGVTFSVRRGEVFAFLGPNGSGKSTTIRMLCGILLPTSGEGHVLGFDIVRQSEQIKQHIGYMSQRFALYEDLSVWENLEFYAGVYNVPRGQRRARLEELIAMAGLEGRKRQLAGQLSGGWKQRLALGCAIVHRPPLLFLDEPTAGVDPVSRRHFWMMIHGLAHQGITVFVTTHYLDEAEHANRVAMIYNGVLRALAPPAELRRSALQGQLLNVTRPSLRRRCWRACRASTTSRSTATTSTRWWTARTGSRSRSVGPWKGPASPSTRSRPFRRPWRMSSSASSAAGATGGR